jgi:hypothetical protein
VSKLFAALVVGMLFISTPATSKVSQFDLDEARLFKEMGLVSTVMAGDAYRCGLIVKENVSVFLDIVQEHYRKHYIQDADRQMTRDWIVSKTAIDFSRAAWLIEVRGCDGFNEVVIEREDETTFTGSLLNYYNPGRQPVGMTWSWVGR